MKKMKFFASIALLSGVALFATSCDTKSNEPSNPGDDTPVTPDTIPAEVVTFDITIPSVYAQSAIIEVTPSNDTVYYYSNALATDTLNAYFATDADLLANDSAYFQYVIEYYQKWYQEELTIADLLYQGGQKLAANSTLLPNTEYTVYAYQLDPKTGKALTEVTKKTFTTKESCTSTNAISFTYTDDGVNIHTTDESPYFFNVYDKVSWGYIAGDSTQTTIASYIDMITGIWLNNGYVLPIFNGDITLPYAYFENYNIYIESGENVFVAAPFDGKVNGTVVYEAHEVTVSESTTGAPAKVAAKGTLAGNVHAPALVTPAFGHKSLLK